MRRHIDVVGREQKRMEMKARSTSTDMLMMTQGMILRQDQHSDEELQLQSPANLSLAGHTSMNQIYRDGKQRGGCRIEGIGKVQRHGTSVGQAPVLTFYLP